MEASLRSPYSLSFHGGTPKYLSVYEKYVRNNSNHTGSVMTREPVSCASAEMYFEVTVEEFSGAQLCLGFASAEHNCYHLPGDKAGVGYRSDGKLLDGSNGLLGTDWAGCSSWGIPGDTVGVGIDITTGEVYCTKNGSFLCSIFKHVFQDYFNEDEPLFPVVAIGGKGCVSVNFGLEPFRYDLEQRSQARHAAELQKVNEVSVSNSCVSGLVEDYLMYHGYGNTFDILLSDSADRGRARRIGGQSSSTAPIDDENAMHLSEERMVGGGSRHGSVGGDVSRVDEAVAESEENNETNTFDELMSLFSPTNGVSSDTVHKEEGYDKKSPRGSTSNEVEREDWGVRGYKEWQEWRQRDKDEADYVMDVRDIAICPSDAALLKYLTYIKLAPVVKDGLPSGCASDGAKGRAKGKSGDASTDKPASFATEPPLLSFPVVMGSDITRSTGDDMYISTLPFRRYVRQLVFEGRLFDVKELLGRLMPEAVYVLKTDMAISHVAFTELWVMLHCMDCLELMVTGTVEEAIEHARRSLYPLLAYSAGGDANSDFICTVPLTSSAHTQNMRKYIDSFLLQVETNSDHTQSRKRNRDTVSSVPVTQFPIGALKLSGNILNSLTSLKTATNEDPTLFAKTRFWSWKSGGTKQLIFCLISLFSYNMARSDMTNILNDLRSVLASALNEKILSIAPNRVERKKDHRGSVPEDGSGFTGVRVFGTPLECGLQKLMQIVHSVEEIERSAQWKETGSTTESNKSPTKTRSTLYGTGCLLTFEDQRDNIYSLLGVNKNGSNLPSVGSL